MSDMVPKVQMHSSVFAALMIGCLTGYAFCNYWCIP